MMNCVVRGSAKRNSAIVAVSDRYKDSRGKPMKIQSVFFDL